MEIRVYTSYIHWHQARNNSNTKYRRLKVELKTPPGNLMEIRLPTPPLQAGLVPRMPRQKKATRHLLDRTARASPPATWAGTTITLSHNQRWEQIHPIPTFRSSHRKPQYKWHKFQHAVNSSAEKASAKLPAGLPGKGRSCWRAESTGSTTGTLALPLPVV